MWSEQVASLEDRQEMEDLAPNRMYLEVRFLHLVEQVDNVRIMAVPAVQVVLPHFGQQT